MFRTILRETLALILFAGIIAASLYGLFRWAPVGAESWYSGLRKPFWTPNLQIARTAWAVVWGLSAVAAWLVWLRRGPRARVGVPLVWFFAQFALTLAWCGVFFFWNKPEYALAAAALVWLSILASVVSFSNISTLAALLMTPALLWFGYTCALNFTIWRWN